ncbi:hypothetical protein TPR58_17925 [Sphingomonas sp. HF-S3]|uniref:Uncharacterized protein n=1 Tax=Sphingomonas rustica TaxID=3103142 RepID=A0ABV0BBX0_9SPHN
MQHLRLRDSTTRGHPIRRTLRQVRAAERRRLDDSDARLFLVSFAAFFICFATFLL